MADQEPESYVVTAVPRNAPLSGAERARRFRQRKRAGARQARGYSWEPFAPGNTAALVHGIHSERALAPVVQQLADVLLGEGNTPPYLQAIEFAPAVRAWLRAEAQALLGSEWLESMSVEARFEPKKAGTAAPAEIVRKLETAAAGHRQRLGLDPLSKARLGRDVTGAQLDLASYLMHQMDAATGGEDGDGDDDGR